MNNRLSPILSNDPHHLSKKLQPLLKPAKIRERWIKKIPNHLWQMIAEFYFYPEVLRCKLSGNFLTRAVYVNSSDFDRMPFIYDHDFLLAVQNKQPKLVHSIFLVNGKETKIASHLMRKLVKQKPFTATLSHFYFDEKNHEVPFISSLTQFALKRSIISLGDDADAESKKFLTTLYNPEEKASYTPTYLATALKAEIDRLKKAGKTTFNLNGFLHRYQDPAMLEPYVNSYDDPQKNTFMFFAFGLAVAFLWHAFYYRNEAKNPGSNLIAAIFKTIYPQSLLLTAPLALGNLLQMRDQISSIRGFVWENMYSENGSREVFFPTKTPNYIYRDFSALKTIIPGSWTSELLKWAVVTTNLLQVYYSSEHSSKMTKSFYLAFELLWFLSGATDVTCRKVVNECKEVFTKPAECELISWKRISYVGIATFAAHLAKEDPIFTLMAMMNALLTSALPGVLKLNSNRYTLLARKSQGEVRGDEIQIAWAPSVKH